MQISRWETERAAWLRSRAKAGTGRQRRYELLDRRARRMRRSGMGVGESGFREDTTPMLLTRLMKSEDGAGDRALRMLLLPPAFLLVGAATGIALGVAAAVYGALWYLSPRIGRLLWWPWVVAGVVWGVAGVLLIDIDAIVDFRVWPRIVLDIAGARFWGALLWGQLALGLVLAGVWIRECGWSGVPKDAVKPAEKNADGSWREVPEDELIRLDPYEDDEDDEQSVQEPPAAASMDQAGAEVADDDSPSKSADQDAPDIPDPLATEPDFYNDDLFDDEPVFDDDYTVKEK